MNPRTPREIIREADAERAIAEAARYAQTRIRLFERPVVEKRTGLLGWWRDRRTEPDPELVEHFSPTVTRALYQALTVVARDSDERVRKLEAEVTTREEA